jgi:hypothetical protein
VEILFPFEAVNTDLVGTPDETCHSTEHRLLVCIEGNRKATWSLSEQNLKKVLFEIGKRELEGRFTDGALPDVINVHVSFTSHPGSRCPFDPERITAPNGVSVQILPPAQRIGFLCSNPDSPEGRRS